MKTHLGRRALLLAGVTVMCGTLGVGHGAPAQAAPDFPSKPVTILSAFPVGSGPDAMMRIVGDRLAKQWQVPVIIENRPGGAGFIAINAARKAPADGYTLMIHDGDTISALPHLFKTRNFRLFDEFEPVGVLYKTPFFIVVGADSPWQSVDDLLQAASEKPGSVSYGSWGVGSVAHLHTTELAQQAGVEMMHVPYKEMVQLYTDVGNGRVDWALGAMASTQFVYDAGRVKYLAVARPDRLPSLAEVPTVAESGGPAGYTSGGFVAVLAPKGTPADLLKTISHDLNQAVASPEVQARYREFNFETDALDPAQTRALIEDRNALYRDVIETHQIRLD